MRIVDSSFSVEDNISLYGVFDGHDGSRVSNFAAQRMPAELLLGQLSDKTEDEQIKEILRQVAICVRYLQLGFFLQGVPDRLTLLKFASYSIIFG